MAWWLSLVATIGFNTNLPSETPFKLEPMLDDDQPIQVYGPSNLDGAGCDTFGVNITNQLPQALVEANGGEHHCKWNVKKIIQSVTPEMPAAGAIRQHVQTQKTCPQNQICPPSPCTLMEMDYQNYCPDGCAEEVGALFYTLLGTTNCGPVFGRGGISGRFVVKADEDVVDGADEIFYPGNVKSVALSGDDDILGVDVNTQLIPAHPRYKDVSVPAWTHIDGLGAKGTVSYDFILMSSTRNPTKGPFCAEFLESGVLEVAGDNTTRLNTTFKTDYFPTAYNTVREQQNYCENECKIRSVLKYGFEEYVFIREISSPQYQCSCWTSNVCTRVATADGSWFSGASVGTTFVRAHAQNIVANGRLSNNLPIRKIGDRDRTSAFRCPSGDVWDVHLIGANLTTCRPHGYEDHLLTCACFHYMLYQDPLWEPPDFSCCKWYTSPFVRTGIGFSAFNTEEFIDARINKTSDASKLNNILRANNTLTWDNFWSNASDIGCYQLDCPNGRDPITVLLGFEDRLAPCCPWFAWDDVQLCMNSEECNNDGIRYGCTMTAAEVYQNAPAVRNFAQLCQGQPLQRQPHVFSQFAKGSRSDFGDADVTKTVDFGHVVQILTTSEEVIQGLTEFKEHSNVSYRRAMPFVSLNPGAGKQSQTGEPDAQSSLFVAFSREDEIVSVEALFKAKPALLRTWSVLQTRLSAADPCWQKAQSPTLTLTFDKNYPGAIKAITVKIDQPCAGDVETGCDESQIEWNVGDNTNHRHFVTISPSHDTIEALDEEDVFFTAQLCPPENSPFNKFYPPCNTSWITEVNKNLNEDKGYFGNATDFWNRYAATTGKYFDENTKRWAIPHASSNADEQFCRWHFAKKTDFGATYQNTFGWDEAPFPHTLPCTKKCRPLTYTKKRTHTCGEPKGSMQMDPKIERDGSNVQLYHFTRPTIGVQPLYSFPDGVRGALGLGKPDGDFMDYLEGQEHRPYRPSDVPDSKTVDISHETCTINVDWKHRASRYTWENAARQVSCKGNRHARFEEFYRGKNLCHTSPFVDFKRVQAWEGWAIAENVCLFEKPYKDMCYFDHAAARAAGVLRDTHLNVQERGYSPYDQFCKLKPGIDLSTTQYPVERICTMSVWTHEIAENKDFDFEKACIQEADGAHYEGNSSPDPKEARHNLYTPGIILGETYRYLGPKPRARARTDKWTEGHHYINPSWEFYDHDNSAESGGNPDGCHQGQYPYMSIWCGDTSVCDPSILEAQEKEGCSSDFGHYTKNLGIFQYGSGFASDVRKIANCYTDSLDPARPKSAYTADNPARAMGNNGKRRLKKCYTCYASDSNWPNFPAGATGPMHVNTVGNVQVPFWSKKADAAFLQSESFVNPMYACRCTRPTFNADNMATSWHGKTIPLDAISKFNNKPVLYVKCCATDSTWRNDQPNFASPDEVRDGDWARTESPAYRWVNYFDGWKPGTAMNQAQCGRISPDVMEQSPNYMATYDNFKKKMQRPKLDIVSPKGFIKTPEGPQQFVVTGVHLSVCATNKPKNQDEAAAGGNLSPALRGPALADVSHTATNERYVPKDYVGRPYFVSEPNDPQPQMCNCGGELPVYACERYTAEAETNVLPPCAGEAADDGSFDCVVCGWTWPKSVMGQSFPLGLFIGSNQVSNVKAMERDVLGDLKTRRTDFLRFFMRAGVPSKEDLVTLINNVGNWGSDFDKSHYQQTLGATSPNQKVHIMNYPGTCLRPPYGRAHRNTLTREDRERYFRYGADNGGLSYLADETLYAYCEQFRGKFIHCEDDPFGNDRELFCRTHAKTVDRLTFGHTLLRRSRACNPETNLCLFIDGDPDYPTFQKMEIPAGATVLVSPVHWNVLSVLQCGNSVAKLIETGYSMSDEAAQHVRSDQFLCAWMTNFTALNSILDVQNALTEIIIELKTFESARVCDDDERSGPSSIAGVRDSQPGQCFPETFFRATITPRLNIIAQPDVTVLSLDGRAILVQPPSENYGMCPVFIVGNKQFRIEQELSVDNTGCDSGFGGAAVHLEGASAVDTHFTVALQSAHMAVAALGMDELSGRLSRTTLNITGLQVRITGNLSAPFVAAISRVAGTAHHTISCDDDCTILLYEASKDAATLHANFTTAHVSVVNVSGVFGQFALTPLIEAHHHWAGKLREATVIYFLIVLTLTIALVISIVVKVTGGRSTAAETEKKQK